MWGGDIEITPEKNIKYYNLTNFNEAYNVAKMLINGESSKCVTIFNSSGQKESPSYDLYLKNIKETNPSN